MSEPDIMNRLRRVANPNSDLLRATENRFRGSNKHTGDFRRSIVDASSVVPQLARLGADYRSLSAPFLAAPANGSARRS
jgi:hypothetical protein